MATPRQVWIDVAKTIAILLVVFYHVIAALPSIFPSSSGSILNAWSALGKTLMPIRMPLFFCVSGILAATALSRSWSTLWRPRILNLLWPFLLWSLCFSLLGGFRYNPQNPQDYSKASFETILYGGNAYWFLSVLVLFFVIARLFRHSIPIVAVVSAGLVAFAPLTRNVAVELLGLPLPLAINLQRIAYFAIWYFVGLLVSKWVREKYQGVRAWTLLVLLSAYGVIAFSLYFLKLGASISDSIYLVLAALGLIAFSALSYSLTRFKTIRRISTYVSQRTLPIYVIHPILLIPFVVLCGSLSGSAAWVSSLPASVQGVLPIVIGLALMLASLGTYEVLLKLGLSWMFVFPGGLKKSSKYSAAVIEQQEKSARSGIK